eukprot:11060115-Karenia_brevis.AAC.1
MAETRRNLEVSGAYHEGWAFGADNQLSLDFVLDHQSLQSATTRVNANDNQENQAPCIYCDGCAEVDSA